MNHVGLTSTCSLVAMLLVACGSGGNGGGMGDGTTATADSCVVHTEDLFASDVYPNNGFGGTSVSQASVRAGDTNPTFYPLALGTTPRWDRSHHGEGGHTSFNASCNTPAHLFEDASMVDAGATGSRPEIQFRFPSFAFPTSLDAAEHASAHTSVQPAAELHVFFERALAAQEGPSESQMLREQVFPMTIHCDTPFQVDFTWAAPIDPEVSTGDTFCRPKSGDTTGARECATFTVRPTGDACTFAIDHQSFASLDGAKVKASLTGELARDTDGGYEVRVIQVSVE